MADRPEFGKKGGPRGADTPSDGQPPANEGGTGGALAAFGNTLQSLPLGWIALTGAGVLALGAAMGDSRPRCEPKPQQPPGVQAPATPNQSGVQAPANPNQEDCRRSGSGSSYYGFGPRFFPRSWNQATGTDTAQQGVTRSGFGKTGSGFGGFGG
jgi:hypothetical protein